MSAEAIEYKEKYEDIFIKYTQLKHELDQLKRLVFGSRHERFVPTQPADKDQLALGIEHPEIEPTPAVATVETISYTRKKKETSTEKVATGRMKLPAHLPREQVVIEPEEDVTGLKIIGKEITEELERIPGKLFVKQYVRPKYSKANNEGVIIAPMPVRPIKKG